MSSGTPALAQRSVGPPHWSPPGAETGTCGSLEARLEAAAKQVRDLGVDALLAPIDVTCPDQAEATVEKIERDSRPVDVWVPVASSSPHLEYLYDLVRLLSARALPPRDGLLALHGTPGKAAAFTSASAAPFAVRS